MRRCLLALALLLFWAGCAQKQEAADLPSYEYVIGVSQANLIEPWCIALQDEIQDCAEAYPNLRLVFADAARDTARQQQDMYRLVELGADLLIVSPNDAAGLQATIAEIYRQVPVIVMERKVPGDQYSLFIGANNRLVGNMAAEYVVELLGEAGGNVVEITGTTDSPPMQQISQGFAEALESYPQVNVISHIDGDWLRDTAELRMKDFLIVNSDVDIIFAHNDAMAYGAYIAARDFRVPGIRFIGVNGLENEGRRLVEQGILAGSFYHDTGGREAIESALSILQGDEDIPSEIVLDPYPVIPEG